MQLRHIGPVLDSVRENCVAASVSAASHGLDVSAGLVCAVFRTCFCFPCLALGWATAHGRQVGSHDPPQRAAEFPAVGDDNRKMAGHRSPDAAISKSQRIGLRGGSSDG